MINNISEDNNYEENNINKNNNKNNNLSPENIIDGKIALNNLIERNGGYKGIYYII